MRFLTISVFVLGLSTLSALAPASTAHAATDGGTTFEVSTGLSDWSLTRFFSVVRGGESAEEFTDGDGDADGDGDGDADEAEADEVLEVEIVPREAWGAQGGKGDWMDPRQAGEVIVHHFWKPNLADVVSADEEAEVVRNVERVHVEDNGWSAFGYHFVIFQSGRIYEGRGWGREGGHTQGRNEDSIAIVFAVDGDTTELSEEAWEAAEGLVALGVARGHLTEDVRISGHNDHAEKSCPGELIAPHIQRLDP